MAPFFQKRPRHTESGMEIKYIVSQLQAAEIADCTGGMVSAGPADTRFSGVSIDTRRLHHGELFFAIRGPHNDGHSFVMKALSNGAYGAVVDSAYQHPEAIPPQKVLIKVEDTHQALKDLARAVRLLWKGTVIGLTGSMGKTTTKEFTAKILEHALPVYRSPGNYNNLYGLPLSLFGLGPNDSAGIFEMGMSERGEIAEMCRIALPDIGIITNVAPVHLEFFDSIEEIADAKAELADALPLDGTLIYNRDIPLVRDIAARFAGRKTSFGYQKGADIRADQIEVLNPEKTRFRLYFEDFEMVATIPLAGAHYVLNTLPAVALGRLYGIEPEMISDALFHLEAPSMRGRVIRFREGFTVIDDSYNSNPEALKSMIDVLSRIPGFERRILIAGEMLELGPISGSAHLACGAYAAEARLDGIVGVQGDAEELIRGAREKGMSVSKSHFFRKVEESSEFLKNEARKGDLILIKGSRGVHMEAVVEDLHSFFELLD